MRVKGMSRTLKKNREKYQMPMHGKGFGLMVDNAIERRKKRKDKEKERFNVQRTVRQV